MVQHTTEDDLSNAAFPYFTARPIGVGYVPVLALRVSYVGELGWETRSACFPRCAHRPQWRASGWCTAKSSRSASGWLL